MKVPRGIFTKQIIYKASKGYSAIFKMYTEITKTTLIIQPRLIAPPQIPDFFG